MAITVSTYNEFAKHIIEAAFSATAYEPDLSMYCGSGDAFTAADNTLALVANGWTLMNAFGWTNPRALAETITTQTTNDGRCDYDNLTVSAVGGTIQGDIAVVFDNNEASDEPSQHVDFGENKSADAGTDFIITWDGTGLWNFTVT